MFTLSGLVFLPYGVAEVAGVHVDEPLSVIASGRAADWSQHSAHISARASARPPFRSDSDGIGEQSLEAGYAGHWRLRWRRSRH
jgi:hypothetical protein